MLPFLKPRKQSGSIAQTVRAANGSESSREEDAEHPAELMAHSERLISAVHAKDAQKVAEVMAEMHEHFNAKLPDDGTPA